MSVYITFIHDNKKHTLNMAEAAELIGMAKSTFSGLYRRRASDDDQETFDHIKSTLKTIKRPAKRTTINTQQAIARREARAMDANKAVIDRFLFGV